MVIVKRVKRRASLIKFLFYNLVSKEVSIDDEEGVKTKEQAILDLGLLFKLTKKAKGIKKNRVKFCVKKYNKKMIQFS